MDLEIWTTKRECWTCGEPTVIWYPPAVGSYAGGTWEPVGEHLAELNDSPIGEAYSETQETFVWGNLCDHCGEYQGNFFVHRAAQDAIYEHGHDTIRDGEVADYDVITVEIPELNGQLPTLR